MFTVHSLKNLIRSWPKSLLFFLLLTSVGITLCVGVSLTATILDFLRECDENYTTIAVFEYIGVDYPDENVFDPGIAQSRRDFDFDALVERSEVLSWDRNDVALGYIYDKETDTDEASYGDAIIAVIYIMNYDELEDCYQFVVEQNLIFPDAPAESGLLFTQGVKLETRRYYLIHGKESTGRRGNRYFTVSPLDAATAARTGVDRSAENMLIDITAECSRFKIPDDSVLFQVAASYRIANSSVTVFATNDLESLLPFHQSELAIREGRGFTEEEYASGANVCVLPERMVELLGVKAGDQIDLSLTAQPGVTQKESYWAETGFLYSDKYTVVGVCTPNDDYRDTVFVPKAADVDLSLNEYAYKLGQARIVNDSAESFYAQMMESLPPRVRITIYDQGYAAATKPLEDVLRVAVLITIVCVLTALAIIALFGFLFVYRQRGLIKTMRRVGASSSGIYHYFLIGSGLLAAMSSIAAAVISHRMSGYFMDFVRESIASSTAGDLHYSNAKLSVSQVIEFIQKPTISAFILTAFALFVFAMLTCFIFTALGIYSSGGGGKRQGKLQSRQRDDLALIEEHGIKTTTGRTKTASRSLRGGSFRYAWLSIKRGASRSAIPVVLCVFAAALLLQLTNAAASYKESYDQLTESTNISGYFTDYRGIWRNKLMVEGNVIWDLNSSGILSNISLSREASYTYGIDRPEWDNPFAIETFENTVDEGAGYIWTNDLAGVQEFYGCAQLPVTFLEGYDISMFSQPGEGDAAHYETGETVYIEVDGVWMPEGGWGDDYITEEYLENDEELREQMEEEYRRWATPIMVSTAFLEKNGFELGDYVEITTSRFYWPELMRIVGSFEKQGSADNIYVPLSRYSNNIYSSTSSGHDPDRFVSKWESIIVRADYVFEENPEYPDLLRHLAFNSVSFQMQGAENLEALKDYLYERGYSEVRNLRSNRNFIVVEDMTYMATERAMSQRLWYMERLLPALYVLIELLAALIPFILIQMRKRESGLMRAQGASKLTAFLSIYSEQVLLGLAGMIIGLSAWLAVFRKTDRLGLLLVLLFALFWLAGAAISVIVLNKGSVRKILRVEE